MSDPLLSSTTLPVYIRNTPTSVNLPYLIPHSARSSARSTPIPVSPSTPTTPTDSAYFPSGPSSAYDLRSPKVANPKRSPYPQRRVLNGPTLGKTAEYPENPDDIEESLPLEKRFDLPSMNTGVLKRKVVIMGSPSVGKTSLTQQYVAPPTYNESYFPTIEATSHKHVTFDGVDYECEIIDSAGQDEYTLFPSKYAVGVHGYLLVYSINSRQSFEMIQTVHDKILDFAGLEKVPCVIVGQKSDLGGERRVTLAEGEALAKKLKAAFVESSAKDNKNVGKAFEILLREMQKEYNPIPEKKKTSWWSWGR